MCQANKNKKTGNFQATLGNQEADAIALCCCTKPLTLDDTWFHLAVTRGTNYNKSIYYIIIAVSSCIVALVLGCCMLPWKFFGGSSLRQ